MIKKWIAGVEKAKWDERKAELVEILGKRRKANGGLTKAGRKGAWKRAGGEERKRVNGKFA